MRNNPPIPTLLRRYEKKLVSILNQSLAWNYAKLPNNTLELQLAKYYEEVDEAIESEEDTLIVCGHGSEEGCFSPHFDYTVSSLNKDKIKAKRFIGIWCNASTFAKKNNILGFFSSMFISNTDEADFMGIEDVEEERIKESERKFVKTLNSLLRNNVPMEKWKEFFNSIMDTTNKVEVFNFTSLEYFE